MFAYGGFVRLDCVELIIWMHKKKWNWTTFRSMRKP